MCTIDQNSVVYDELTELDEIIIRYIDCCKDGPDCMIEFLHTRLKQIIEMIEKMPLAS